MCQQNTPGCFTASQTLVEWLPRWVCIARCTLSTLHFTRARARAARLLLLPIRKRMLLFPCRLFLHAAGFAASDKHQLCGAAGAAAAVAVSLVCGGPERVQKSLYRQTVQAKLWWSKVRHRFYVRGRGG